MFEQVKNALDRHRIAPGFLPLYAALSLASLPIARDKGGLSESNEVQLRELLTASLAEANSGREGAPCA